MPSLAEILNGIWYGKSPLRFALWPVSAAYVALARLRRTAYRRGWRPTVETPVPVIVVGNVSVGGTGKTPFVIWLAEQLKQRGRKVGIVTRGYRGKGTRMAARGDRREAIRARSATSPCSSRGARVAPSSRGPTESRASRRCSRNARVDVILSDDGLQHYRLARAFEVAVVDGARGMGNGLCLPAGPLREPVSRLQEVDAIVVNGGDWGHAGVFRAEAVVTKVYHLKDGALRTLESFRAEPVHAVAGIGNPQRFFDLLRDANLDVEAHPLEDHAEITLDELTLRRARRRSDHGEGRSKMRAPESERSVVRRRGFPVQCRSNGAAHALGSA